MNLPRALPLVALWAFAFWICSAATPAQADKILVEVATGSGVTDGELDTATTLIAGSVGEVSSDTVVNEEDGADIILRPTLVKLGQAYILGLSKLKDGKIVNSGQLKALRIEELDRVAERLTRSVLRGENAKANPRVGEITEHEAVDGVLRRPTRSIRYFGFGGSLFSNLGATDVGYSVAVAHAWDFNRALIKILAQCDFNSAALFLNAALGGNYFLTLTDIAPYIGADFGGGAAKTDGGDLFSGETVGGFIVGVTAGVQLLRTSAVNLDLGFRAAWMLRENQLGIPQSYALRLGLFF